MDSNKKIKSLNDKIKKLQAHNNSLQDKINAYKQASDLIQDFIFIINKKKKIEYVNTYSYNFFNKNPEDLIGKDLSNIFPKDVLKQKIKFINSVFKTGEIVIEKEKTSLGKHKVWLLTQLVPVKNKQGHINAVIGISRNITKQKNTEIDTLKNEKLLENILSSVYQTFIIIYNCDGIHVSIWTSDIMNKYYGIQLGEYKNKSLFDVLPKNDAKTRLEIIQKIYETGKPFTFEAELKTPNGIFWHDVSLSPIKNTNGNVIFVSAFFNDITNYKNIQYALLESKSRYKELIESLPETVFELDLNGNLVFVNDQGLQLFGYNEKDLKKTINALQLMVPKDQERVRNNMLKILNGEISGNNEYTACKKDGTIFHVIIKSTRSIKEGKTIGTKGIIIDITERKKMEEELQKSQRLESLGLLAGGIAHDFNNFLTSILGNIDLAKTSMNPMEDPFARLTNAEKAAFKAKNLTEQLLTFSKGGEPIKEPIYITEIIKDTINLTLSGSNVKCISNISKDLMPVEADEGQITQVINNLIINAKQAMPGGGVIKLNAKNFTLTANESHSLPSGEYIQITIKNEGEFIPEDHIKKIFDPYFTTKSKGSGLGLATIYTIVQKHNGKIEVTSKENEGTTFCVTLPAYTQKVVKKTTDSNIIYSGTGKILLMDDDLNILQVTREMLNKIGYETEWAKDGNEALKKYKEALSTDNPFDALIIDITIPEGMGGKETMDELLKINPKVNAIVTSGYSDDPIMANYLKYGFKDAIRKPYKIKQLSAALYKIFKYND